MYCIKSAVIALSLSFACFATKAQDTLIHQSNNVLGDSIVPVADTGIASAATVTDSGGSKRTIVSMPLSLRSVVIPAAMIGYGAFALSNAELRELNLTLRREIGRNGANRKTIFDDYTKLAPAVAVYGLNLAGVKGKNNLLDATALYGMANLIGSGITGSVKRLADVVRPDSSNRLSFPSGHTTQAFIAAEFMRQEYKHRSPWYGIAGYAVAASTGLLRMYNNKHWLNDVVAGAGVGILATRLSYWLYPKLRNAIFKEKKSSTVVMPYYQERTFGVGMVHRF